jgi:tRNA dimethylallyltransferase
MLLSHIEKPVFVILGPTGVGKTDFSLDFAKKIHGEIISADSRLFYRGMDIGTAKPSKEEMQLIPHHLIDVCEPDENWSLALYQEAVNKLISEIHAREHIPILVGGTGQYIKAIVEGWDLPNQEPDDHLREILEEIAREKGKEAMYKILTRMDPETLNYVEYQNTRRVVRALEVILRTGKPFSDLRQIRNVPYSGFQIGIKRDRETLYKRIDFRIEKMFTDGFIDEVKALIDKGYGNDVPSMSAIGYREVSAYLAGEISLDDAVMLMKRYTRQYVRRQANWFKESDPKIHWYDANQVNAEQVIADAKEKINWILPNE